MSPGVVAVVGKKTDPCGGQDARVGQTQLQRTQPDGGYMAQRRGEDNKLGDQQGVGVEEHQVSDEVLGRE